jgi:hypothetical protein
MRAARATMSQQPVRFFGYWSGELPRVTELHFRSFVHRHPHSRYELWLDDDHGSTIRADELQWITHHPQIEVRRFSLDRLIEKHVSDRRPVADFDRHALLRRLGRAIHRKAAPRWTRQRCWEHELFGLTYKHSSRLFDGFSRNKAYRGDLARCLVPLEHYDSPCLYVDLDVCFMASLLPLCHERGFTYRWEDFGFANSAILYLPDAASSRALLELGRQLECFLPWILFTESNCAALGLTIHPTRWFDPLWDTHSMLHGDPGKFFAPRADLDAALRGFVAEGHLAVHWHNHWKTVPAPDSLYAALLRASP